MNYLEFFELHQEPFSNAPVARFYYDSQQHGQALMRLRYSVEQMKGLAVLVGDIGAGKTTLARRLLDSLPEDQYDASLLMIVHAETTQQWLLSRIALLLGVDTPSDDKLKLLSQVYQRLVAIHEAGRKAVVLIDEAQMLRSRDLMEEFRGLLNLELTEQKLLTFVFFGLPDLDDNLRLDEPLAGRVALRVRLEPLSRESTAAYVAHRLKLAGARRSLFAERAIDAVHRFSRGTPRLINTVCDNALLESFFVKQPQVDEELVARVARDLGLIPLAPKHEARPVAIAAAAPSPAPRVIPPSPAPRVSSPANVRPAPIASRPAAQAQVPASRPMNVAPALATEQLAASAAVPEVVARIVPSPPPAASAPAVTETRTGEPAPLRSVPPPEGEHALEPELPESALRSEPIEIPQIDALDDIDSILDQLEDKG